MRAQGIVYGGSTFNSLYEIQLEYKSEFKLKIELSILFMRFPYKCLWYKWTPTTFNSLYEIQRTELKKTTGRIFVFQFSLWDSSIDDLSFHFLFDSAFNSLYEIQLIMIICIGILYGFQFSLWDSISLISPALIFSSFQFSLWDSTWLKLLILFKLLTFNSLYEILAEELIKVIEDEFTFNSLYEILNAESASLTYGTCFQFSLWDSMTYYTSIFHQKTLLSILFMRFCWILKKEIVLNIPNFQFSLWDSLI